MKHKHKKLRPTVTKFISWILAVYFKQPESGKIYTLLLPLINRMIFIEDKRGLQGLVVFCKTTRNAFHAYLEKNAKIKETEGVSCTADGVPTCFGKQAVEEIRNDNFQLRKMINTLLYVTRDLSLGKDPVFDTITMEVKTSGQKTPPLFRKLLYSKLNRRLFFKSLGIRKLSKNPRKVYWKKFHLTVHKGPLGHALHSSAQDLKNLRNKPELFESVKILGGSKLASVMDKLGAVNNILTKFFNVGGDILRKISWFPDKELKVRVIAMGDYYSQTALKGLHDYLFGILKKIPQDCTFNQGSFVDKIQGWKEFVSCDLTAATDRFPIKLEMFVLEGIFTSEYVQAWYNIRVGEPFRAKGHGFKTYAAGNPRGMYSSWNTFALSHHYMVFTCCQFLKRDWKKCLYVLLGDDILLGCFKLAKLYKDAMTDLGVDFSVLKTHESNSFCEFASRHIYKGTEISPFPFSALKETGKRYHSLLNLVREEERKGWCPTNGTCAAVTEYQALVLKYSSRKRTKTKPWLELCKNVLLWAHGKESGDTVVKTAITEFKIPIQIVHSPDPGIVISNEEGTKTANLSGEKLIGQVAVWTFAKSDPDFVENLNNQDEDTDRNGLLARKPGVPLGTQLINLSLTKLGLENQLLQQNLRESQELIPQWSIYNQFRETLSDLRRQAEFTDIVSADWPVLFKTRSIPRDDRVFYERDKFTKARNAVLVGKELVQRLRDNSRYPNLLADFDIPTEDFICLNLLTGSLSDYSYWN